MLELSLALTPILARTRNLCSKTTSVVVHIISIGVLPALDTALSFYSPRELLNYFPNQKHLCRGPRGYW